MKASRVLFLGEGEMTGPARYFASVLRWARIPFDHRPDQSPIPAAWMQDQRYGAIILSDYRYRSFNAKARRWLIDQVTHKGRGFLMIGGWASFTGLVGGYAGTDLEQLLPVRCVPGDDRVNKASVVANAEGGIRNALRIPLSEMPLVCGYHRARPKPGTQTVLSLRDLHFKKGKPFLGSAHPLLVLGRAGAGRSVAFLTDCAPHWAGGLVDWGQRRVRVRLTKDITTEVGEKYLHFFTNVVRWSLNLL